MTIIFVCLLLLMASSALLATVTAMIVFFVSALFITQWARWKISLHLISMTGAVLSLGLVLGPLLFLLTPLLVFVGWAQWLVKAHTHCKHSLVQCWRQAAP